MYGFECPICKKVLRLYSIFSHLVTHGYRFRAYDYHEHKDGIFIFIKGPRDEVENSLFFKKVKLSKAYKKVFADKLHTTLDTLYSSRGEEDA